MIDAAPMPDAPTTVTAQATANPDWVFEPTHLDGSGSDPHGRTLSFAWHFTKVPPGSAITDSALMAPGSATSFVPDRGGDYSVMLTVTAGSDSASTSVDFTVPTLAMFHFAMTATADTSQLAPRLVRSDGTGEKLVACGESLDAGTSHWDAGPSDMETRLFLSAFNRALDVYRPDVPGPGAKMAWYEQASHQLLLVDENSACPGMPLRLDDPASQLVPGFVRFSPDGNRLAYLELSGAQPRRLITVGADGMNRHIVRANPNGDPLPARVIPVWSDAQRITWVEVQPSPQNTFAIMQAADLSDLPPVVELLECQGVFDAIDSIGFPATGEIVMSARPPGGRFDLYREPMGGPCDTSRKLTNEPAYSAAMDLDIAPDRMSVAYWSAASELQAPMGQRQPGDIFLVRADGTGSQRRLVGATGLQDYQPRWVAGGRQLTWTRLPAGEAPDAGGTPTGLMLALADGTGERVIAEDSAIPGDVTLRLGASNGGNACSGLPGMITGGGWMVVLLAIVLSVRGRAKRASRASRSDRT